jgi:hypothetical protein
MSGPNIQREFYFKHLAFRTLPELAGAQNPDGRVYFVVRKGRVRHLNNFHRMFPLRAVTASNNKTESWIELLATAIVLPGRATAAILALKKASVILSQNRPFSTTLNPIEVCAE